MCPQAQAVYLYYVNICILIIVLLPENLIIADNHIPFKENPQNWGQN